MYIKYYNNKFNVMIRKIYGSIRNKVYIESKSTKQYLVGF